MSKLQCQAEAIRKLQSDLCEVLQHNINTVLVKSWSAGLIGRQVYQLSSSDPERTSKFMSAIYDQVRTNPSAFDMFTKILQETPSLAHLADRLKEFNQQASSQLTGYCEPCKETVDHSSTIAAQGKSVASDHKSLDIDIIDKLTAANHDDDVQTRRVHSGHKDNDVKDRFSTALQSFSSDVNSDAFHGNSSAKILEPVQESLDHDTASRHVFVGNVASEPDGFERIRHWTSVEASRSREMKTRAVELKQKVEKVTQENEKLKKQLEEIQKNFNSLKEQLDQANQKIEELEEQKQLDDKEICRIKGEFESLQRESEKTKKELEEKLDLESNEAKVLERQLKKCESEKMEAENKLTEQAKEVERLRKEYEAFKSHKEYEIEEVKKLFNEKIEELEKEKREDELQHKLEVTELLKKLSEFEKTSNDELYKLSLEIKEREIEVEKMKTQIVGKDAKLLQMETQQKHQEAISQLKEEQRQVSQEFRTRIRELEEEKQKILEKGFTSPDTSQVGSITEETSILFTIDEDSELLTSYSDLSLD